jgi:hypothetical protein
MASSRTGRGGITGLLSMKSKKKLRHCVDLIVILAGKANNFINERFAPACIDWQIDAFFLKFLVMSRQPGTLSLPWHDQSGDRSDMRGRAIVQSRAASGFLNEDDARPVTGHEPMELELELFRIAVIAKLIDEIETIAG